jgi:hypothetical protein
VSWHANEGLKHAEMPNGAWRPEMIDMCAPGVVNMYAEYELPPWALTCIADVANSWDNDTYDYHRSLASQMSLAHGTTMHITVPSMSLLYGPCTQHSCVSPVPGDRFGLF